MFFLDSEQHYRNAGRHRGTRGLLISGLKDRKRGVFFAAVAMLVVAGLQGILLEFLYFSDATQAASGVMRLQILVFALCIFTSALLFSQWYAHDAQIKLLALIDELAAKSQQHPQGGDDS